jgi:hypothetical protein
MNRSFLSLLALSGLALAACDPCGLPGKEDSPQCQWHMASQTGPVGDYTPADSPQVTFPFGDDSYKDGAWAQGTACSWTWRPGGGHAPDLPETEGLWYQLHELRAKAQIVSPGLKGGIAGTTAFPIFTPDQGRWEYHTTDPCNTDSTGAPLPMRIQQGSSTPIAPDLAEGWEHSWEPVNDGRLLEKQKYLAWDGYVAHWLPWPQERLMSHPEHLDRAKIGQLLNTNMAGWDSVFGDGDFNDCWMWSFEAVADLYILKAGITLSDGASSTTLGVVQNDVAVVGEDMTLALQDLRLHAYYGEVLLTEEYKAKFCEGTEGTTPSGMSVAPGSGLENCFDLPVDYLKPAKGFGRAACVPGRRTYTVGPAMPHLSGAIRPLIGHAWTGTEIIRGVAPGAENEGEIELVLPIQANGQRTHLALTDNVRDLSITLWDEEDEEVHLPVYAANTQWVGTAGDEVILNIGCDNSIPRDEARLAVLPMGFGQAAVEIIEGEGDPLMEVTLAGSDATWTLPVRDGVGTFSFGVGDDKLEVAIRRDGDRGMTATVEGSSFSIPWAN